MESIKSFFEYLRKDPITSVRYILVVAGIFVTFQNLFDCITQEAALYEYFFYVMTMGALTLSLVFVHRNSIICFVFSLSGILMIFDSGVTGISGGVAFLIFSKRIANNLIFSFLIYCTTSLVVVANHTFHGKTPSDSVNVIIGYFSIFLIDYILEGVHKTL